MKSEKVLNMVILSSKCTRPLNFENVPSLLLGEGGPWGLKGRGAREKIQYRVYRKCCGAIPGRRRCRNWSCLCSQSRCQCGWSAMTRGARSCRSRPRRRRRRPCLHPQKSSKETLKRDHSQKSSKESSKVTILKREYVSILNSPLCSQLRACAKIHRSP